MGATTGATRESIGAPLSWTSAKGRAFGNHSLGEVQESGPSYGACTGMTRDGAPVLYAYCQTVIPSFKD